MADNIVLVSGETVRALEDGNNIHWPAGINGFVTSLGSPDTITIPVAAALTDGITTPVTLNYGSCLLVWNGTTWDRAPGNAANGLLVNLGSNNAVTMSTLPDTAASDLAAINAALGGTLNVDGSGVTQPISHAALTELSATINAGHVDVNLAAAAATVTVDGSGVIQPISHAALTELAAAINANQVDVNLAASAATVTVDCNGSDVVVTGVPAPLNVVGGGTEAAALRVTLANDSTGTLTVDNAGTFAVQTTLQSGDAVIGQLKLTDGTEVANVNASNQLEVSVENTSLAVTSAAALDVSAATVTVDGSGVTQPISNAALTELAAAINANQVDVNLAASAATVTVAATQLDVDNLNKDDDELLVWTNTAKDGTGIDYVPIVDTDGHLQVDVLSGGGAGTQYTEDDAAPANPIGGTFLVVRDDSLGGITPVEGDWTTLFCDANGALWTTINGTVTISNLTKDADEVLAWANTAKDGTGTDYVPIVDTDGHLQVDVLSGGGAGTQYTTDEAAPAAPIGGTILAERDDALAGLTPVEGDWSNLLCNAYGAIWVAVNGTVTISNLTKDNDEVLSWANTAKDGTGTDYVPIVDTDGHLQVDVLSGGGAGTQYTKDDAAPVNPIGGTILAERDDTLAGLTPVEGDWSNLLCDAYGAVWVAVNGTVTIPKLTKDTDGVLSWANTIKDGTGVDYIPIVDTDGHLQVDVLSGGGAGTQYTEDDAVPANPVGGTILAERDDALAGLTPVEGDWSNLRCDAYGAIWVAINGDMTVDCNGSNVAVASVPAPLNVTGGGTEAAALRVTIANDSTGVLTVDNGGTFSVQSTLQAGDNVIGQVKLTDGTEVANVNASNQLEVSVENTSLAVTSASALDVSAATVPVDLGANNDVQGATAHDSAVSGNPFLQAAEARSAEGTAVASGDVVRLMADLAGRLVQQPYAPVDAHWHTTGSKTDTSELTLNAAAGAGIKNYLVDVTLANTSSTAITVILKDGSGGAELWRYPVPANGGVVFTHALPLPTTANTALVAVASAAASSVYISASGYTGR